jgi:hypothetical protein
MGFIFQSFLATVQRAWIGIVRTLLDVTLYVSSHQYRARLREAFARIIESYPECPHVWLVTHSLGSVIALDSLMSDVVWKPRHSVVLMTCGSPLRRLLTRYYADLFFPADLTRAAGVIASRLTSFRWLNVYRPLDYIGKRLHYGKRSDESIVWTWWPWHTGYWSDRKAVTAVVRLLDSSSPIAPNEHPVYFDPAGELSVPSAIQAWVSAFPWLTILLGPLAAYLLWRSDILVTHSFIKGAFRLGAMVVAGSWLAWEWLIRASMFTWMEPRPPSDADQAEAEGSKTTTASEQPSL